jgi:hypothetical protein
MTIGNIAFSGLWLMCQCSAQDDASEAADMQGRRARMLLYERRPAPSHLLCARGGRRGVRQVVLRYLPGGLFPGLHGGQASVLSPLSQRVHHQVVQEPADRGSVSNALPPDHLEFVSGPAPPGCCDWRRVP